MTPEAVPEPVAPTTLSFDSMMRLEETSETSANVSMGDINADGHLDLLLVKGRHWPLHDLILIGDGAGRFLPPRRLQEEPDRSYSGVLVDIDGDRDLDAVVSNDQPDTKRVFLNDGTGSFVSGSEVGRPAWPTRHIKVVDMNRDGLPDVIFANRTADPRPEAPKDMKSNFLCLNQGGGVFNDDCLAFSEESATTVTPADVNGDGLLDLVVPHRDGGQSYIYLQDQAGSFQDRVAFGPSDAAIRAAEVADVDGDGILDIVVVNEFTGSFVLWGEPGLSFAVSQRLGPEGVAPYAVAIADVNKDERPDIVVGHVNAKPIVFFNGQRRYFLPVEFGDNEGTAYGFAVGDINEDGFNDIAMARSDAPNVLFFGKPKLEQ
jgi:hypothetical protein